VQRNRRGSVPAGPLPTIAADRVVLEVTELTTLLGDFDLARSRQPAKGEAR